MDADRRHRRLLPRASRSRCASASILPLQTLSNLLAALGEGDFSIRARGARGGDPLGEVMIEVNTLVETLRHQRLDALEATTLLRKVMAEIDVAVFTFDEDRELKFVNRAGARLLGAGAGADCSAGRAEELGLEDCLDGEAPRVINTAFPGGVGRWEIRRSSFRQGGRPHELLVLSDLSQPLREEERQAWQRLIRVIGHEMNNSLAPIKSIAGSLATIVAARAAAGRLARRRAARPRRDRVALRVAEPLHERLRAAGQAAAAQARAARRRRASSIASSRSRRGTTSRSPAGRG